MSYRLEAFRCVKHGLDGVTAYCRHCNWSGDDVLESNVSDKAKRHAKINLHTVDVYRTHHTEFTSHVKDK